MIRQYGDHTFARRCRQRLAGTADANVASETTIASAVPIDATRVLVITVEQRQIRRR